MVALFSAFVLTFANSFKSVVVDDTAYLMFARHLAVDPTHPYDFQIFWYHRPQPAMEVLLPPVLPYWLAAGIFIFGERLILLKLWLFPFAAALCFGLSSLLRQFANGFEQRGVILIAFSGFVLPLFNFMLDIPALALGTASLAMLTWGCERRKWAPLLAAGLVAGLAMQTKYSMLTLPFVSLWYGVCTGRSRGVLAGFAAAVVAVGVAGSWEWFVDHQHGESHFLHHLKEQLNQSSEDSEDSPKPSLLGRFRSTIAEKWHGLALPLCAYVGGLASGFGLLTGRALGFGRRFVIVVGVIAVIGFAAVCFLPKHQTILLKTQGGGDKLDVPMLVFNSLGVSTLIVISSAAILLVFRPGAKLSLIRRDSISWFLLGWFVIELGAYFVLTPFPAGRRVVGVCLVASLIACRSVSLMGSAASCKPERWISVFIVVQGLWIFSLDVWDARAERIAAERAFDSTSEVRKANPSAEMWFLVGHWGWQYYCEHAGMKPVVPGVSILSEGNLLFAPIQPEEGFHRPHMPIPKPWIDPFMVEELGEDLLVDDPISGRTIPELYGGVSPVLGRDHPRLRIRIYKILHDWTPNTGPQQIEGDDH